MGTPSGIHLHAKPDDFFEICDVADRCGEVVEAVAGPLEAATRGDDLRAWSLPLPAAATQPE